MTPYRDVRKNLTRTVLKYCQCMVNEMDSNDSRSVTQFEKANPKTMKMCERKAGWK